MPPGAASCEPKALWRELSTRYLMVEQTTKMPPRRRGGTLSTSAARQVPSGRRSPAFGKFDDSLGDLYASRLSHAAAAIGHVHGTNDVDAAFAVRPTLRSAECLTECSAAPRADDPSGRPQPGKPTANVITATTSAPKPKRSNLHRSSRA